MKPCGLAPRDPKAANVQEVAANSRALRTAALIALVFGVVALDADSVLAGPCADTIKRVEAVLDALTSSPNARAVHQPLRAQRHQQPSLRSVARGQEQAIADEQHHRAALERDRTADANRNEAGCSRALPELRHD